MMVEGWLFATRCRSGQMKLLREMPKSALVTTPSSAKMHECSG